MQGQDRIIIHVIDDDEAVRESLDALLFAFGFDAETYSSAEDFLARASTNPGCLILDINMPGMSGLDLLEQLVEKGCQTPAIILTANPDERLRQRARELGAVAYLTKPVTEQDLLGAIEGAKGGS